MAARSTKAPQLAVIATLLSPLVAVGCGGDEDISPAPTPPLSYTGAVEGSDARVALVAGGDELVAYVCGGPSSFTTLTRWFRAPLDEPGEPFFIESDGFTIEGSLDGPVAQGAVVTPDGARLAFQASATGDDERAGLYAAEDEGCLTGTIVTPAAPGEEPDVQGTWCSASGAREQVIPIRPVELQSRGLWVRVVVDAEPRSLFVTSIRPHAP